MSNFFKTGGAAHMSDRLDWATPKALFDALDAEFGFTLDVCASDWNAKCRRYFSEADDGLSRSWAGEVCFMNPPYGRQIGKWIEKGYNESLRGAVVVALIPARTDTGYWHKFIEGVAEVRFIRGRIKYELPDGPAAPSPFPSCVVIWRDRVKCQECGGLY